MVYEVPSFTEAVTLQPGQQSLRLDSMSPVPPNSNKKLNLPYSPTPYPYPLPLGMARSKELIQKNTSTRSSAPYKSTLPRKALPWGGS